MSEGDISLVGRRLLIVEDDVMIAAMLQDMVRELGCEVVATAYNPADALAVIKSGDPLDAAILDLNLRGKLSHAVADALAARRVPFVVATGYRGQMVAGRFAHEPIVYKPFTKETLGLSLQRALGAAAGRNGGG